MNGEPIELALAKRNIRHDKLIQNPLSEEALREIYFDFYDLLEPVCRISAKDKWDYNFAVKFEVPENVHQAISRGFFWLNEGVDYWYNVYQDYKPGGFCDPEEGKEEGKEENKKEYSESLWEAVVEGGPKKVRTSYPPREEKAMRYNEGKLNWELVDWNSLEPMVEVLMFGAEKYAPDNWKKPMDPQKILESLFRHYKAISNALKESDYTDRELMLNDPESTLPHVGHLLCNAMFLCYHLKRIQNDV